MTSIPANNEPSQYDTSSHVLFRKGDEYVVTIFDQEGGLPCYRASLVKVGPPGGLVYTISYYPEGRMDGKWKFERYHWPDDDKIAPVSSFRENRCDIGRGKLRLSVFHSGIRQPCLHRGDGPDRLHLTHPSRGFSLSVGETPIGFAVEITDPEGRLAIGSEFNVLANRIEIYSPNMIPGEHFPRVHITDPYIEICWGGTRI